MDPTSRMPSSCCDIRDINVKLLPTKPPLLRTHTAPNLVGTGTGRSVSDKIQPDPQLMPRPNLSGVYNCIGINTAGVNKQCHLDSQVLVASDDLASSGTLGSVTDSLSNTADVTPSSISKRRQASNRPILSLRVQIPTEPLLLESLSSTPLPGLVSPVHCHFATFFLSSATTITPQTPVDQLISTPLIPPELPRTTTSRRRIHGDHWVSTPTEGVIPTLSYIDDITAPHSGAQLYSTSPLVGTLQGINEDPFN